MRYYSVQYIRAFAALSVIYIHITYSLFDLNYCGAIGVDLFFITSGFIMTNSIEKLNFNNSLSAKTFFINRFNRIYPLYFILTSFFALLMIFYNGYGIIINYIYSILFIPYSYNNIYKDPILFAGWSLNFEIFFYLMICFSIYLNKKKSIIILLIILAFIGIIGLVFDFNNILLDFILNDFYLEFLFGIISYYIINNKLIKYILIDNMTFYFIISILLFFIAALGKDYGYVDLGIPRDLIIFNYNKIVITLPRSIIWGIPSFFLFITTVIFFHNKTKISWLEYLGNISYSLYLIQVPIIYFYNSYLFYFNSIILKLLFMLLTITLIFILSIFSNKFLENILSNKQQQ
jgi:exopolysaccharide production protein ExoZ